MLVLLLSQVVPTAPVLPEGAGWVATGLLVPVMIWLLWVHLPAKDKQVKDLLELKDNQIKEILAASIIAENAKEAQLEKVLTDFAVERVATQKRYDEERNVERIARHEKANQYAATLGKILQVNQDGLKEMQKQHISDAKADRDSFDHRYDAMIEAIKGQTAELKVALLQAVQGVCRAAGFQQHQHDNGPWDNTKKDRRKSLPVDDKSS